MPQAHDGPNNTHNLPFADFHVENPPRSLFLKGLTNNLFVDP